MPSLTCLTPHWPGDGVVEGVGTTCFTLSNREGGLKKERNLPVADSKLWASNLAPRPLPQSPRIRQCPADHLWGRGTAKPQKYPRGIAGRDSVLFIPGVQ